MDGVMIHIGGEGYKETKLGPLFEVANFKTEDKERPIQAKAVNQRYELYLGGPEEFGRRLHEQAQGWGPKRGAGAVCHRGWRELDLEPGGGAFQG